MHAGRSMGYEPPDRVLAVAAMLGDLEAFDALVSRYRAAVVRVAGSVVGAVHAEDVAQDVFLLAFKALPSLEDPSKFAAWLRAITRNHALRFLNKEQEHQRGRVDFDEMLITRLSGLSQALPDDGANRTEMLEAVERLPADYALVLRLRFFDEMPLKRIAAFLGVTVSTVKWRVHRGKALLREEMESERKD